jgi:hypothetical protein
MSTKSKSYAVQISDAQTMSAGLKANLEALKKRGVTKKFIASLDTTLNSAIAKNNEQEKLKADLKASTAAVETLLAELNKMMSEATKVVKLDTPKEQWKEFGIVAKR